VNDQLEQLLSGVNLYRALGGGWSKVVDTDDTRVGTRDVSMQ